MKLNLAIIGQGRSGRDIHGLYYIGEANKYYNVKYVVEADESRREKAKTRYEGCQILATYQELFDKNDIDLVVNASYSEQHYQITKELLENGKNVLCEKPFCRNRFEGEDLIRIAKEKGLLLAVFQQTFFAPFVKFAYELIKSGKLGDIKQINIRYNNFARRWDWQTLQKKLAGSLYNTGPHPIGLALGFLDFDKDAKLAFSKLDTAITSGDGEDYAKLIFVAPNKPVVDVEMHSIDGYCDYNLHILGTKGNLKSTPGAYKMKYIVDGENPERPVIETSLSNAEGNPMYCGERLNWHEEEGTFGGNAFDTGTAKIYEDIYNVLTGNKKELYVTPQMAVEITAAIDKAHVDNPLPRKF